MIIPEGKYIKIFNFVRKTKYLIQELSQVGSGEIVIDDSEWEELIEEVGGDAFAARQLAVRRRSSARSVTNYVI